MTAAAIRESGFAVIHDLIPSSEVERLSAAYDAAFDAGAPPDLRRSSCGSDIRLAGLIGRAGAFDGLCVLRPILDLCEELMAQPFKLSSISGRTVLPGASAQRLHVDVSPDYDAWPLVAFIVMLDDFRSDNGATRFVPGSHRAAECTSTEVVACGRAGSVIVYDGSTRHGYGGNRSGAPRRSIQGAYVPRRGKSAMDWASRLGAATIARLPSLARYLLEVDRTPLRDGRN